MVQYTAILTMADQ